ncbi:MAG: zinc ribbon domain-containing protein [Desulfurococcaceae archaeon]
MKVVKDDVYVSIYFRKVIKFGKPKTVMIVDVNLDNVTLAVFAPSGELLKLKRYKTPLRKMLMHRVWIERIQKRYPKSWRFIKGVRRAIKGHGEKIKSIAWDYAHKIKDSVAKLARKYRAIVVLEDSNHLRDRVNDSSSFSKKLSLWFYRKIQFTVSYKALERGLETRYVNPRKSSSTCPKRGNKLRYNGGRILRYFKCGFVSDRDVVACINLFLGDTQDVRCLGLP